jgi:SpoVK/Ycf46/Vps4 family AAA+-type ATPase
LSVSLSDIFDKYVGEGEKNVKGVFSLARKLAPCVVFLDEVDGIFSARRGEGSAGGGGGSKREVMNEFMSEWDGIVSNNRGVVIMGATNRPFDLDDAILRRMPRRVLGNMDFTNSKSFASGYLHHYF